ncbi:serine O-acetyltransferase [Streptomyces mexicanus]|uniref:serine O-acetyltransferase n=1 Tax=Streptomyces mexicanus TaxID=178566 RepID=UPI0036D1EE69
MKPVRLPRRRPPERRLLNRLREVCATIRQRDPSVHGTREALLHPWLTALALHRLGNRLYRRGRRCSARLVALTARHLTQIEIHPGASIGRRVFVDHGAAVVIGETAVVEDDVTLFHQVTLGSVGWWHDGLRPPGSRRHPRVGAGAVLGCGATVLGPVTVGAGAVVGAGALVVHDVPGGARVLSPLAEISEPGTRPAEAADRGDRPAEVSDLAVPQVPQAAPAATAATPVPTATATASAAATAPAAAPAVPRGAVPRPALPAEGRRPPGDRSLEDRAAEPCPGRGPAADGSRSTEERIHDYV